MAVVGADGCRGGWFAVRLEGPGGGSFRVFPDVGSVWTAWHDASLILMDVPIGLPDASRPSRQCDTEARRLLGRRHPTVFTPPCWEALDAATCAQASRVSFEAVGRRLSQQAWAILPRIREVNGFLLENRRARTVIREVHPEVCFWALNGGGPMNVSKKRPAGRVERRCVLARVDPRTDAVVDAARRLRDASFGMDDVLDALAAAITADCGDMVSIPKECECDARGLRMEMVHRGPPPR